MRKAVLISIQPKWCELIASGKKTVEVRKSRPKIDTPFKCYIYCTNNQVFAQSNMEGEYFTAPKSGLRELERCGSKILSGKVIGEFVCKEIEELKRNTVFNAPALYSQSRLTRDEYFGYIGNKTAYIWYISGIKIYDRPRELSEFKVTRPPQSWCYVEEREDNA